MGQAAGRGEPKLKTKNFGEKTGPHFSVQRAGKKKKTCELPFDAAPLYKQHGGRGSFTYATMLPRGCFGGAEMPGGSEKWLNMTNKNKKTNLFEFISPKK